ACAGGGGFCGGADFGDGWGDGPPDDQGPPTPPAGPPPTGTRWEAVSTTHCGREGIEWVLVDEVCGGIGQPGYLDAFQVPMFRDGAVIGDVLYAVDASHLWVLDVSDPAAPRRIGLASGFGRPLAVVAHQGRLLLASADDGLVIADVSDPRHPVRTASVALPGPALDLEVERTVVEPATESGLRRTTATSVWVAAGAAGLVRVELESGGPRVAEQLPIHGYAAAVAVRERVAYVAACDALLVVDLAAGRVIGRTWVGDARVDGRLVAPAKDVVLAGDHVFVAAGRRGAVAVDVSDPEHPFVRGNCTIADDPAFYASGVRVADGRLYVAGGEWGVLDLPAENPGMTCRSTVRPPDDASDGTEEDCAQEPPWVVLPWEDVLAPEPPPRGRDPVQTLPAPGVLYAFGDARRIGLRAVEVRDRVAAGLEHVGRYDEPRLVSDMAFSDGRLLVVGPGGGLFRTAPTEGKPLEQNEPGDFVRTTPVRPEFGDAVAAAFLGDGRWVTATADGTVFVEDHPSFVVPARIWPHGIATDGDDLLIVADDVLLRVLRPGSRSESGGPLLDRLALFRRAELPAAVLAFDGATLVAAAEWPAAIRLAGGRAAELDAHGVFDPTTILDPSRWLDGLPRRLLAGSKAGVVELASLGQRAALVVHAASDLSRLELAAGDYVALAADVGTAYVVSADRDRYVSQVAVVDLLAAEPTLTAAAWFTGVGAAAALGDDGRLYVGDADRGVRVFERTEAGGIVETTVELVEEAP
ncbi:MAG: hypothetical protein HY907_23085, partial [Deltaproteobacteria bacterium]|nr:hypothetical protein [Deltaproteobacteria bacterium]